MLLEWKACEMIEMNIQIDHVHLIVSVPPKVSISQLMGILKRENGKQNKTEDSLSIFAYSI
jgi:REP element-mobilizing transposase RayT